MKLNETELREKIRERIRARGAIAAAANACGISRGYVSEYLRGMQVNEKTLKLLADYAGLEIQETRIYGVNEKGTEA